MTMLDLSSARQARWERRRLVALRRAKTMQDRYGDTNFNDPSLSSIKMVVTPWTRDEAGNLYRLAFAAGTQIEDAQ